MNTKEMVTGGYRYIPGVRQYSAGVEALSGFRIIRTRVTPAIPMDLGFELIGQRLDAVGRPKSALCACELRSPQQFSENAFRDFNTSYIFKLRDWEIMENDDNPVARSNVCPESNPPPTPVLYAFSYTIVDDRPDRTFVIAGSGEAPEGKGDYASVTVRLGDTTEDGMEEKANFVVGEMERRMAHFGANWDSTTTVQLYTVFDAYKTLANKLAPIGAAQNGVTWHYCRPPVVGLDFEMDCRRVLEEETVESGSV